MQTIDYDKAAEKVCPFMSKASLDEKGNQKLSEAYCLTSGCMAWIDKIVGGKCLLIPDEK